jgi:methyl coenzyme M reductase subunit C-like uncharacterized protein (methanogenesis marker protein 7)
MKLYILATLALSLMGGSFYAGYRFKKPTQITVTQQVDKEVEKEVIKTVRETVTQPGGTVVVRETVVQDRVVDKVKQVSVPTPVPLKRDWSVGLNWEPLALDYKPVGVEVGWRAVGDVWLTGGANWKRGEVLAGLRVEF